MNRKTVTKASSFVAVIAVVIFTASIAFAGLDGYVGGGRSTGMGNAYTAIADDFSSLYFNPAGMSQLEKPEVGLWLCAFTSFASFEAKDIDADVKGETTNISPLFNLGFIYPDLFIDGLAVGTGLYVKGGSGAHWDEEDIHPGVDGTPVDMLFAVVEGAFGISYEPIKYLSLGASLSYYYMNASIDKPLAGYSAPTHSILEGTGSAMQYTFGALIKPTDWLSIGLKYRMPNHKTDLDGSVTINTTPELKSDAIAEFGWVQLFSAGISVKPIDKLTLALDYSWRDWSYIDKITMTPKEAGIPTLELAGMSNNSVYMFGAEYMLTDDLPLRFGYIKVLGINPKAGIDTTGYVSSFERNMISMGSGFQWGNIILNGTFTVSVQEALKGASLDIGKPDATTEYSAFDLFPSFSIQYLL